MAEEFLGKNVSLNFLEKKPAIKEGKIESINDLGIVFTVENYRNSGLTRSEIILREDILGISELLPKIRKSKKGPAKPKPETPPVVARKEDPTPPGTDDLGNDFVDDSEFEDEDDLNFDE
jgi:hypothetical protein